ncbi:GH32 C-terminal domain-containing protein [Pseudarthrobacter sp. O4]
MDCRNSGNTDFHKEFPSIESPAVDLENGVIKLRMVIDHCSVEGFRP